MCYNMTTTGRSLASPPGRSGTPASRPPVEAPTASEEYDTATDLEQLQTTLQQEHTRGPTCGRRH